MTAYFYLARFLSGVVHYRFQVCGHEGSLPSSVHRRLQRRHQPVPVHLFASISIFTAAETPQQGLGARLLSAVNVRSGSSASLTPRGSAIIP